MRICYLDESGTPDLGGGTSHFVCWMIRRYLEQEGIAAFESLGIAQRRAAVRQARDAFLIRKAALQGPMSVQEDRKNFRKTDSYIHLTLQERREVLVQIASAVSKWDDCRIFGECIDKRTFGGRAPLFVDSTLTSMVQVADVCAYAARRFCENGETGLFDIIYPKFNKVGTRLVGVRHYTRRDQLGGRQCRCRICVEH